MVNARVVRTRVRAVLRVNNADVARAVFKRRVINSLSKRTIKINGRFPLFIRRDEIYKTLVYTHSTRAVSTARRVVALARVFFEKSLPVGANELVNTFDF